MPLQVDGITYNNYILICLNRGATVWLAISYAYKGLLQLVAMFMAFHTRRVDIKVLNDSKEIAVIVYVNSIILALIAVVEFTLNKYHEVYTALIGLALLLEATVFLALIFIPKVSSLKL
jgi:gamma-aminobutyric acid type B receptor